VRRGIIGQDGAVPELDQVERAGRWRGEGVGEEAEQRDAGLRIAIGADQQALFADRGRDQIRVAPARGVNQAVSPVTSSSMRARQVAWVRSTLSIVPRRTVSPTSC
jgi:hypothetical protein